MVRAYLLALVVLVACTTLVWSEEDEREFPHGQDPDSLVPSTSDPSHDELLAGLISRRVSDFYRRYWSREPTNQELDGWVAAVVNGQFTLDEVETQINPQKPAAFVEALCRWNEDCHPPQGQCINGYCKCRNGYGGDHCEKQLCPNGCSEHGQCVRQDSIWRCMCEPMFEGDACQNYKGHQNPQGGAGPLAIFDDFHGSSLQPYWEYRNRDNHSPFNFEDNHFTIELGVNSNIWMQGVDGAPMLLTSPGPVTADWDMETTLDVGSLMPRNTQVGLVIFDEQAHNVILFGAYSDQGAEDIRAEGCFGMNCVRVSETKVQILGDLLAVRNDISFKIEKRGDDLRFAAKSPSAPTWIVAGNWQGGWQRMGREPRVGIFARSWTGSQRAGFTFAEFRLTPMGPGPTSQQGGYGSSNYPSTAFGECDVLPQQQMEQPFRVQLRQHYEKPVVFFSPVSSYGSDPTVPRISEVNGQAGYFSVYLQQPSNYYSGRTSEVIHYCVFEEGDWQMENNGPLVSVGSIETQASVGGSVRFPQWENVQLMGHDPSAKPLKMPVLFAQVQSNKEPQFCYAVVQGNPRGNNIGIAMIEDEDRTQSHGAEKIGYLAVETAVDNTRGSQEPAFEIGQTYAAVGEQPYTLDFNKCFFKPPAVLAGLAEKQGANMILRMSTPAQQQQQQQQQQQWRGGQPVQQPVQPQQYQQPQCAKLDLKIQPIVRSSTAQPPQAVNYFAVKVGILNANRRA